MAPIQANRLLSFLSMAFSLAIRWEWLKGENPVHGIERYRETKRDRFVTPTELPALIKSIMAESDPYVRAFFILALLTGARKSELLNMRWEDVDLDVGEWRIPETKAGRVHTLPLSRPAIHTIDRLPRVEKNPFVLVGHRRGTHLINPTNAWHRILKRSELNGIWIHDLRRTLGSYLAMRGASLPLIGKVLNHSNPSTTQVYARFSDSAPRAALEEVGASMLSGQSGAEKCEK